MAIFLHRTDEKLSRQRQLEANPTVLRKNSIQRLSTQCNIVTSDRRVRAVQLNIADFKGVPAGWHFGDGQPGELLFLQPQGM